MPDTMSTSWRSDMVPSLQRSISLTAHYTYLPNTLKPPEDSPPALGGTEQVAYRNTSALRAQGQFQSKQRGRANSAVAADALQTPTDMVPSFPFAFVWLFGAFLWACAGPEASSCLPCLIRCEQ